MRRLLQCMLVAALLVTTGVGFAQGDRYPLKPIQIISTATPGSQSDTLMRFLGSEV